MKAPDVIVSILAGISIEVRELQRSKTSFEDRYIGGIYSYSVLKVPAGCVDAYKKAKGWNEFTTISELD